MKTRPHVRNAVEKLQLFALFVCALPNCNMNLLETLIIILSKTTLLHLKIKDAILTKVILRLYYDNLQVDINHWIAFVLGKNEISGRLGGEGI